MGIKWWGSIRGGQTCLFHSDSLRDSSWQCHLACTFKLSNSKHPEKRVWEQTFNWWMANLSQRRAAGSGNRDGLTSHPDGFLTHTENQGWQEEKIEVRKANTMWAGVNGTMAFCCYFWRCFSFPRPVCFRIWALLEQDSWESLSPRWRNGSLSSENHFTIYWAAWRLEFLPQPLLSIHRLGCALQYVMSYPQMWFSINLI